MSNEDTKKPEGDSEPTSPAEEKRAAAPAEEPKAKPPVEPVKPAVEAKPVEPVKPAAEAKPVVEKKAAPAKESLDSLISEEGEQKRVDPKDLKAAKAEKKAQAQAKVEAKAAATKGGTPGKKGKDGKKKGKDGKKKAVEPFVKRAAPPRLKTKWANEVVPAMMKQFGYKTNMAVPRLVKITLNMGLGEALLNAKLLDAAEDELAVIAGQKPVITKARKSIATYKLRQGQKIGCMVTLRRERMFEFLDRLVSLALPRTRDFKGISPKSFDGRGNFSIGIREQIIFPEIDYDKIEKIMGLNITIVTTANTDEEGRVLLKQLGMPIRSQKSQEGI